ncbi:MAG: DUF2232 domain-containing protein [Dissulfurimicrobium sp.]|uniref:DUF2232 domain-containing protein n=1 Tax=Dissulfurimicrobium sp. TaxID=2022436 RepID=UPI0040498F1F
MALLFWIRNRSFFRWIAVLLVIASPFLTIVLGPISQFFMPGLIVGLTRDMDIKYAGTLVCGVFFVAILSSFKVGDAGIQILLVQILGFAVLLQAARYKNWSGPHVFLAGLLYLISSTVFMISLGAGGDFTSAYVEIEKAIIHDFEQGLRLYKESYASSYRPEFDIWFRQLKITLRNFLPGLVGLSFLAVSLSNVLIAKRFLHKNPALKDTYRPDFIMWKMPEHLVWLGIAAGAIAAFGHSGYVKGAENCLLLLGGVYFVQGFSIAEFFFKAFNAPFFIRWPVFFLLMIQWYGLLTIAIIGLLDIWFDLRSKFS